MTSTSQTSGIMRSNTLMTSNRCVVAFFVSLAFVSLAMLMFVRSEQCIKDGGVEDRVQILDIQKNVLPYYRAADVVLCPSINEVCLHTSAGGNFYCLSCCVHIGSSSCHL